MHLLAFLFLLLMFCSEALMFFAIICFKSIWFSFYFYFVFSGKLRKTYLKLRKTKGAPSGGTFKGAPVISWVILFLVQGIHVLVINLSVWWGVSVDLKIFEFFCHHRLKVRYHLNYTFLSERLWCLCEDSNLCLLISDNCTLLDCYISSSA